MMASTARMLFGRSLGSGGWTVAARVRRARDSRGAPSGYGGPPMPKTALIVVDMVQTYDFEDAEKLVKSVEAVVEPLTALIERGKSEAELVIYVNDNFGEWHSER